MPNHGLKTISAARNSIPFDEKILRIINNVKFGNLKQNDSGKTVDRNGAPDQISCICAQNQWTQWWFGKCEPTAKCYDHWFNATLK